jgi:pyruvate ferredoxin oxidoreductase beta subunit
LEVTTGVFPYTAWTVPWIHVAFENNPAVLSGAEAAYKAFKKKGKINKEINFLTINGDGGTYDIGFQSLSGAAERNHNILYICYNNEGYQNTGYQRSSATPIGAFTKTTPVGSKIVGKKEKRKDLTLIMAAHEIPYTAQANPFNYKDFTQKVRKAKEVKGFKFINVLQSCTLSWRTKPEDAFRVLKLATESLYWPLYEVIEGKFWRINIKPKKPKPIEDYIAMQPRWRHVLKIPQVLDKIKEEIYTKWDFLNRMEKLSRELAEDLGFTLDEIFEMSWDEYQEKVKPKLKEKTYLF